MTFETSHKILSEQWEEFCKTVLPMTFADDVLSNWRVDFEIDDTFAAGVISSAVHRVSSEKSVIINTLSSISDVIEKLKNFQSSNSQIERDRLCFLSYALLLKKLLKLAQDLQDNFSKRTV